MEARRVDTSENQLALGAIIAGRYRLETFLSEGGMGLLFRARHVELGYPVAIKVVRDSLASNAEVVERTLCEARTMARIKSEHIVQVLDVGRMESGSPYIVMEYLEGEDLSELLARTGAVSPELTIELLLQACKALSLAHEAGIVHRDLKPENLWLSSHDDGQLLLKVLDFGIAKDPKVRSGLRRALTNPSLALGTPCYMAPEQMLARQDLDQRADIWGLGAVGFELLTGVPPFQGESFNQVFTQAMSGSVPAIQSFRPGVPKALDDAILGCLRKDPNDRYPTVGHLAARLHELEDALRATVPSEGATVCPLPTPAPLTRTPDPPFATTTPVPASTPVPACTLGPSTTSEATLPSIPSTYSECIPIPPAIPLRKLPSPSTADTTRLPALRAQRASGISRPWLSTGVLCALVASVVAWPGTRIEAGELFAGASELERLGEAWHTAQHHFYGVEELRVETRPEALPEPKNTWAPHRPTLLTELPEPSPEAAEPAVAQPSYDPTAVSERSRTRSYTTNAQTKYGAAVERSSETTHLSELNEPPPASTIGDPPSRTWPNEADPLAHRK
jgi:serine/threonine-protein kinase